jgi:hypothetical protein
MNSLADLPIVHKRAPGIVRGYIDNQWRPNPLIGSGTVQLALFTPVGSTLPRVAALSPSNETVDLVSLPPNSEVIRSGPASVLMRSKVKRKKKKIFFFRN